METELINNIVRSIPHPDTLLDNPGRATLEITEAMMSQTTLLQILFSGNRQTTMVDRLEQSIREQILKKHPEYENNLEKEILITFLIRGNFHAFFKHSPAHPKDTIEILAQYSANTGSDSCAAAG